MTHAIFSPSKLPRIIQCPGSARFSTDQAPSSYADEGTLLHSIVEDHLLRDKYEVTGILHKDRDKHIEYKDAVESCLQFAFTLKAKLLNEQRDFVERIEHKVTLAGFEKYADCAQLNDVSGTLDYSIESDSELYVIDWKFGKGVIVSPESDQLKAYALGMLKNLDRAEKIKKVICIVGQPRVGDDHFRPVEYTSNDLLRWLKYELSPALLATQTEEPILKPSEEACRWCGIKNTCKARHSMALDAAQRVFAAHAKLPNHVDFDELKVILDMIPQLDQYIKDLTNFAFNTITSGGAVPGYKVVRGRSNRVWSNEEKIKDALEAKGHDTSEMSDIKFWGPAKVEKVVKDAWLKDYIVKPEGKLTLTIETDKREAVSFKSAEETFADYAETDQ